MSDSYYGTPVLNETIWGSPDVPGYLFFGGLAGASSMLAAFAHASGNRHLARASKTAATVAIGVSAAALVKDLGRPLRFLNMLRVVKVTSPMSVGTWLITGYGPLAAAAAASALTGKLPKAGAAATVGAAALGAGVSTYTAALICDTAVPAWHDGYREMPYLFAGSAASAAGGFGMLAVAPQHARPAIRFAVLGAVTELTAKSMLLRRLEDGAKPYQEGRAGQLMEAGEVLTAAGLAGAVLGGRDRSAAMLSGLALLAASALTRFGVFEAGRASARDPRYTVQPQRRRLRKARTDETAEQLAQPDASPSRVLRSAQGPQPACRTGTGFPLGDAAWPCGRQRHIARPLPSGPRSYFFLLFLPFFLLFFAMHITPLHDPEGQQNVDRMSTYH
jgi:formate-dependent nitrite reductase membrane component NrfD